MQNPRPLPPQMQRRYLAPEVEAKVRELWLAGASRDEVARAVGITTDMLLSRLKDQLADLPRRGRGGNVRMPTPDPTEEEIAVRAAELRRSWTIDRYLPEPPDDPAGDTASLFTLRPRSRR